MYKFEVLVRISCNNVALLEFFFSKMFETAEYVIGARLNRFKKNIPFISVSI